MKKCPYCAEEIQDAAIVCRYCERDVQAPKPPKVKTNKLRNALLALASIVFLCCSGVAGVSAIRGTPVTPTPTKITLSGVVIYSTATHAATSTALPTNTVENANTSTSTTVTTDRPLPTSTPFPTIKPLPTNTRVVLLPAPTSQPSMNNGASAICNDGTYSYSAHRRGTCSHHGGVAQWLKNLPA